MILPLRLLEFQDVSVFGRAFIKGLKNASNASQAYTSLYDCTNLGGKSYAYCVSNHWMQIEHKRISRFMFC